MSKRILIICFLTSLFCCTYSFGQQLIRPNSIYIEGKSGNGTVGVGFFSVNYDRRISKKNIMLLRLGFSRDFNSSVYGVPTALSWITSPLGKHHFEGGFGCTHRIEFYDGNTSYDPFSMLTLQYRYTGKRGLLFRTGINYYGYSWYIYYPVNLHLTFSLGYSF